MSDRIAELAALVAAATPKPWIEAGPSFGDPKPRYITEVIIDTPLEDDSESICGFRGLEHDVNEANAAAIVALRNHADALLAVARAAKAQQYARKQVADNPGIASYVRALDAADGAIGDALDRL